jgi:hypothetical protein
VPIAPEQSATAATAEPESSAPTLLGHPVDTSPSRDDALELGSDAARGHKPITSADHIPACDPAGAAGGGRKLSVMPDCGGRSDLIAAARRAAQAASGVVSDEVSAIAKIASRQAGGIGKLHLLIGATAAIVLVLGLLQIARILVSSSDQSGLVMPTDTAASLETTPAAVREPAVIGQPVVSELPAPSPTPPRPAIFFAEGGTVDTPLKNVLLPGWTHGASAPARRSGISRRCEQRRSRHRRFDLSIGHVRAIRGQSQARPCHAASCTIKNASRRGMRDEHR